MATLKATTINDTGFLTLPVGTTAQRPAGATGFVRFNSSTSTVEGFTGSLGWAGIQPRPQLGSPTFINSSTHTTSSASSITVNTPVSTTTGDLLVVAAITGTANSTWTPPSGWDERWELNTRYVASRIWDGSSSYTFNASSTVAATMIIMTFRNAAWGNVSEISTFATNPIAPQFYVPSDNSIVVGFASVLTSGDTYTIPTGFTSIASSSTNNTIALARSSSSQPEGFARQIQFTRATGSSTVHRALQFSISPAS